MSNSSIQPIDGTLSGITTPGQSGLGNNGNEGVLDIPQIPKAETWPSNDLMSYPELSGVGSYPSEEMQSVNSRAPADWA